MLYMTEHPREGSPGGACRERSSQDTSPQSEARLPTGSLHAVPALLMLITYLNDSLAQVSVFDPQSLLHLRPGFTQSLQEAFPHQLHSATHHSLPVLVRLGQT